MMLDGEAKSLERADYARHLEDRVLAELGHGTVRGDAGSLDVEPGEPLVPDVRVVRRGLGDHDRAGALEETLAREELRALAADFLPRGEHQCQPRRSLQMRRELERG